MRAAVREGYGKIAQERRLVLRAAPTCCGSSPVASEDWPSTSAIARRSWRRCPRARTWVCRAAIPTRWPRCSPAKWCWTWAAAAGSTCSLPGKKVGATGRAIGVDMTAEMLAKARKNIAAYRERTGLDNVEFRLGEIEHLPVADTSVDAVISNCVINLSPDKPQVWREIARVLKPGGRVAVSDLALLKPLPPAVAERVEALVGCVAGAVLVSETERMAKEAGLTDIVPKSKSAYIDGMVDWQDPLYQKIIAHLPAGAKPSDYITSLEITARKQSLNLDSNVAPRRSGCCG